MTIISDNAYIEKSLKFGINREYVHEKYNKITNVKEF